MKTVVEVEVDQAAESYRTLKAAEKQLAQADARISEFRRKNYATHDGAVQLVASNIGERAALDREAFQLCRSRDHAMTEFQNALRCWIQLNGTTGGNKNAGQQSVS
jgi:hypothetical protein